MKQRTHTRRRAQRKQFWLRLGIWVFIVIFAFSIVGGLLFTGVIR